MRNHSVVPNAIKKIKQVESLKITWSVIPRKNATFVNFAVMVHILKTVLIDTS
jgi:hypothetical protein